MQNVSHVNACECEPGNRHNPHTPGAQHPHPSHATPTARATTKARRDMRTEPRAARPLPLESRIQHLPDPLRARTSRGEPPPPRPDF
eukprot:13437340-Alexandrium_andersonii.AAC.2